MKAHTHPHLTEEKRLGLRETVPEIVSGRAEVRAEVRASGFLLRPDLVPPGPSKAAVSLGDLPGGHVELGIPQVGPLAFPCSQLCPPWLAPRPWPPSGDFSRGSLEDTHSGSVSSR